MHERLEALLDRRDVSQRMPEYGEHQAQVIVPDTKNIEAELRRIRKTEQQALTRIALTDREVPQSKLENFPVLGACRYIVMRPGEGGDYSLSASSTTPILEANETRIGGQIVNIGAGSVKLFLRLDLVGASGALITAGAPCIALSGNGGAWDLEFNGIPWCGNVIAVVGTTATEVTVAAF